MEPNENIKIKISQQQKKEFMIQALKEAEKAFQGDEVPVGCIFVLLKNQKYEVIARSHNLTNATMNASSHCQINCLKQMEKELTKQQIQKCILFVTIQPCIMCTNALNLMNIRKVYFGQYNERFGGCGSVFKHNQFQYQSGILQKQCTDIIRKFYERGNQKIPEQQRHRARKKVKLN